MDCDEFSPRAPSPIPAGGQFLAHEEGHEVERREVFSLAKAYLQDIGHPQEARLAPRQRIRQIGKLPPISRDPARPSPTTHTPNLRILPPGVDSLRQERLCGGLLMMKDGVCNIHSTAAGHRLMARVIAETVIAGAQR